MNRLSRKRARTVVAGVLAAAMSTLGLVATSSAPAHAAITPGVWYTITSAHSDLALDIDGASTEPGAELIQWHVGTGANQQFRFIDAGDGYYRIEARHSGHVLDVYEWNAENGATIAQWTDLNGTNQQWSVTEHADGSYSFINRFSGKALDLWNGSTEPGARISQYTYIGGTTQQWNLAEVSTGDTLTNPIRSNGADPWIEYWDGYYYLSTTTWDSTVVMRRSATLEGLKTAPGTVVWDDSDTASRCCKHWAPEFHRIDGTWYLMYTSGVAADYEGQRLHILRSTGDTPMGPYEFMATPIPDRWNIDGSYLELNGGLYMLWSEWLGDDQSIWIAEMTNPWTLEPGTEAVISRPEYDWETVELRVNEAPAVLQHDGQTFITYSASYCGTPDYKLGMLTYAGGDPLSPSSWDKRPTPVFEQGNGVYGPAHNGFFTSPDGTEHWLVYHGNTSPDDGCGTTRQTRVQPFTFNADGTPDFGEPVPNGAAIPTPSGE